MSPRRGGAGLSAGRGGAASGAGPGARGGGRLRPGRGRGGAGPSPPASWASIPRAWAPPPPLLHQETGPGPGPERQARVGPRGSPAGRARDPGRGAGVLPLTPARGIRRQLDPERIRRGGWGSATRAGLHRRLGSPSSGPSPARHGCTARLPGSLAVRLSRPQCTRAASQGFRLDPSLDRRPGTEGRCVVETLVESGATGGDPVSVGAQVEADTTLRTAPSRLGPPVSTEVREVLRCRGVVGPNVAT